MDNTDINTAHDIYKARPTPENLHAVVQTLAPTIHYTLASLNAHNDPVIQSKALLATADAVEKYDPTKGASLPTFVTSQLRQLTRAARQQRNPIAIPERLQLDRYALEKARKEFTDKQGREPDTLELADHTGLPVRRIEKIQTGVGDLQMGTEGEDNIAAHSEPDFEKEALDYVYHDADHTDRRVLDMRVGYAGHPIMEPKDVAIKLNLTPSQLSRRSARLAMKIQKINESLTQI